MLTSSGRSRGAKAPSKTPKSDSFDTPFAAAAPAPPSRSFGFGRLTLPIISTLPTRATGAETCIAPGARKAAEAAETRVKTYSMASF